MPVYTAAVTVPASTPEDTPVVREFNIEEDYVTSIDVYFPPGCCGLCRARAYYGSEQIAPKPAGSDFRGDGALVKSPMRWRIPERPCPIRFELWNLDDTYEHTPILYIVTAEEEEAKPYKVLSDFVSILKKLMGIR